MGFADMSTLKQRDSTQFCDEIKENVEDNEVISTHNVQNKQNNNTKKKELLVNLGQLLKKNGICQS